MPAGGGMTGKCQTIGLETLPFGNATLVAPAKAGIHWKRPDVGRRRNDGKCQTIGLETLPSLRQRKPAFTGNARMPGWRRGDGQVSKHRIGNAALVAPAKAGIHWKRAGAGWRRDDGQVSNHRIGNAAGAGAGGRLAGGMGLVV